MAGREGPGSPGKARKPREGPEAPGRPGSPGKPRKGPESPREGPGSPGRPGKGPGARESPGGPGKPSGGPGKPRKPSGGPGKPRKTRKTRKARKTRGGPEAPEDPGKARKAPEGPRRAPGCKRPCPETGEALPGCLSGRRPASGGRRRDCRCTACGGQASPLFPTPPQAGCGQGGCGLAPVQGRLSASLKQVPGCLKGRCPATWVHERAEIAPNRAQRQRPAASGRSRGDCPRCRVKIQPQGAFFGA